MLKMNAVTSPIHHHHHHHHHHGHRAVDSICYERVLEDERAASGGGEIFAGNTFNDTISTQPLKTKPLSRKKRSTRNRPKLKNVDAKSTWSCSSNSNSTVADTDFRFDFPLDAPPEVGSDFLDSPFSEVNCNPFVFTPFDWVWTSEGRSGDLETSCLTADDRNRMWKKLMDRKPLSRERSRTTLTLKQALPRSRSFLFLPSGDRDKGGPVVDKPAPVEKAPDLSSSLEIKKTFTRWGSISRLPSEGSLTSLSEDSTEILSGFMSTLPKDTPEETTCEGVKHESAVNPDFGRSKSRKHRISFRRQKQPLLTEKKD